MKEHKCPEDLERILELLNERHFQAAEQEPLMEDAISVSNLIERYRGEERELYRNMVRYHARAQERVSELLSHSYGNSFDEIRVNLRAQVGKCPDCLSNYRDILNKWWQYFEQRSREFLEKVDTDSELKEECDYPHLRALNKESFIQGQDKILLRLLYPM
jgi:hypothetical protein